MSADINQAMLLVSILQLLANLYQIKQNNDPAVVVLQDVSVKLKRDNPSDSLAYIDAQLDERLNAEQANLVKGDIALLESRFGLAVAMQSFEYFDLLEKVFDGAVAFCSRNNIFRLRGRSVSRGKSLELRRTSQALFTPVVREELAHFILDGAKASESQSFLVLEEEKPIARLYRESGVRVLPLLGAVEYKHDQSNYWSSGRSTGTSVSDLLCVVDGSEGNQVIIVSEERRFASVRHMVMLRSRDVKAIIEALAQDIVQYSTDIAADQEYSNTQLQQTSNDLLALLRRTNKGDD